MYIRTDGGIDGNLIADRISYPSYMKRNFNNVSWGKYPDNGFLATLNIFPLVDNPPEFNSSTQRRTTVASTYDPELGSWVGNYIVEDIPQEELDQQEVARREGILANIRTQRDQLLRDSDWVMTPDAPILNKNQWVVYRQLLRDITSQNPNPDLIVFPQAPPTIPSGSKVNVNYSGVFNPLGSPSS